MTDNSYEETLLASRQEKDRFFQSRGFSPILSDEREKFTGLHYFPVDPQYRFELELRNIPNPNHSIVPILQEKLVIFIGMANSTPALRVHPIHSKPINQT